MVAIAIYSVIAIGIVNKNLPGMVEDNIQHHANTIFMRGLYHVAQIVARAKVRIDVKKILDAVTVISVIGVDLLEHRTEPDSGHAQDGANIPSLR